MPEESSLRGNPLACPLGRGDCAERRAGYVEGQQRKQRAAFGAQAGGAGFTAIYYRELPGRCCTCCGSPGWRRRKRGFAPCGLRTLTSYAARRGLQPLRVRLLNCALVRVAAPRGRLKPQWTLTGRAIRGFAASVLSGCRKRPGLPGFPGPE